MTVGERIKAIREDKNITQEELASRLGLKGKSSVCKIEAGGDNISTKSIKRYAEALNVTVADLMGWTETKDDIPAPTPGTGELLDLFYRATPDQRQAVINLLRSFVSQ